jgi:hypothetical protein
MLLPTYFRSYYINYICHASLYERAMQKILKLSSDGRDSDSKKIKRCYGVAYV